MKTLSDTQWRLLLALRNSIFHKESIKDLITLLDVSSTHLFHEKRGLVSLGLITQKLSKSFGPEGIRNVFVVELTERGLAVSNRLAEVSQMIIEVEVIV